MQSDVPLAPLTTFGIGGPARFLIRVHSVDGLAQALAFAHKESLKVLVLGGGSNVLVADQGFDGLVIKIEVPGIERQDSMLVAGAGESWDALVQYAVAEGLWGIENLSGIPGTVGGAVVGSIGAYGQAVAQTVHSVDAYNRATGTVETLTATQCHFGYRESLFSAGGYIVVRVRFALALGGAPNTSYKDLSDAAGLSLPQVRERVLAIRAGKFPDLAVEGTAGSFFKNPVLAPADAAILAQRYPGLPLFALPESAGVKVPLAWLLDKVLGLKGLQVGGARLYEKQPLVVAARRGTSANDVDTLAHMVEEKIKTACNLVIEREVKIIF